MVSSPPKNVKTEPASETQILNDYEEILHRENPSPTGYAVLDCVAIGGAMMTLWLLATL